MMDWDSHRYLECFFAVPMMGAVLQTVNVRLTPEQVLYTINHAEDDVILVNRDFLPLLEAIHARIRPGVKFVLITTARSRRQTPLDFAAEYEAMLARAAPAFAFPDFDENTRATTFYTTGTTGLPKGVYFSHRQLVLHTLAVSRRSRTRRSAFIATTSTCRSRRCSTSMPGGCRTSRRCSASSRSIPGATCRTCCSADRAREGDLLALRADDPADDARQPRAADDDLRGWKVIIGGSALPPALARAAVERGIDIFAGYGMSETCPILTLAHLTPQMLSSPVEESCPTDAAPGGRSRSSICASSMPDMNDVAHDGASQGEIVVRSPWLTQGYLGEPERSEELWRGGYLHTGDVGVIDAHGYVKITDRIKDVIKTGGEWVSSLDLEDMILRVPGVAEVAVVGVPDDKWGERPLAFVVVKAGHGDAADRGGDPAARRGVRRSGKRFRNSRCPIACTSSTRFRRRASASSTRS